MLLLPEDCIQLLCSLSLSFDCAVSQANLTTDVVGTFTKRFKAEAAAKKAAIADKVSAQRELAAVRAAMQTLECDRNSAIASAKVRCHDVRSCPLSLCKQAGGAAQNLRMHGHIFSNLSFTSALESTGWAFMGHSNNAESKNGPDWLGCAQGCITAHTVPT
jgi:hypothetical protein